MTENQWECSYFLIISLSNTDKIYFASFENPFKVPFVIYTDMPMVSLFGMKQLCTFGLIPLIFNKRHFEFLQATGSPKMIPAGLLNLKETDLKFLRVFFPHCNNPESTSNFEDMTSGSWPGCCSKLTLQGSRWKWGLAQGRERLSASSNARKEIGLRKIVRTDSAVCLMSRRS